MGSRFAALEEEETADKKQKDGHKSKKDKSEKSEKVSKKSSKDKDRDRDRDRDKEKDKEDGTESRKPKKESVEKEKDDKSKSEDGGRVSSPHDLNALIILIVARVQQGFAVYSRQDCRAAAEWLGVDLKIEDIPSPEKIEGPFAKQWSRMLKHLSNAINEGGLSPVRLADLWELGRQLKDEPVRTATSDKLLQTLEQRYETDSELRAELDKRAARRKLCGHRPKMELLEAEREPSLDEKPLELIGQPLALKRPQTQAAPEALLFDTSRRSFVFRLPRILPQAQCRHFFDILDKTTPWHVLRRTDGPIRRSTCWHTWGGCRCEYTYGEERVAVASQELHVPVFDEAFRELTQTVFKLLRPDWTDAMLPNSANLNLYGDGSQIVGWHADDESLFAGTTDDCVIVSLSLGATREFQLAPKLPDIEGTPQPNTEEMSWVGLEDGDIVTMEGLFQKHYVHGVPGNREVTEPRINVTWRWVRDHKKHCPMYKPPRSPTRGAD